VLEIEMAKNLKLPRPPNNYNVPQYNYNRSCRSFVSDVKQHPPTTVTVACPTGSEGWPSEPVGQYAR